MKPGTRLAFVSTIPLLACGDEPASTGFADTRATGASAASETDTTGGAATLPTTGHATTASPTTTSATSDIGSSSGDEATSADTTVADTTATDTGTAADTSTSTGTSTTTTTTATTADDTTTGCPEGQEGCACGPGDGCDAGLQCVAGVCLDVPVCGDGEVEGGEACDAGPMNSNTGACKLDCTAQQCGDGFTGPGEACDDGNQTNGDGCETTCVKTPVQMDKCGQPIDGPSIEIDYDGAFSPTNPDWAYNVWTEPQWAPSDKPYPYINALGGVVIHNDQGVIGTVALLDGTNKSIRVFIGLGPLVSYTSATACVEGRSYSVSSSVKFRVENALNDCGSEAMMSNDWFDLHPTSLAIASNCFLPGNDFQAIEVRPVSGSGSLSLKRLRLTLHGAVY